MKKLFAFIIILAVAYGAWRLWSGPDAQRGGRQLFYGRAWVDHLPASQKDKFHVFGTSKRNPFGWFAERTVWKGAWEAFRYEDRGDGRLEILLPHSGDKRKVSYRAWRCNEKDFDFCLELSGVGEPSRYYSKSGWERDSLDEATLEELFADSVEP